MAVELNSGRALGALNLTPLIDVVFLLLIFFLVATKFAEEDREMDFPLPDASEAVPAVMSPLEITINVDETGRYVVGGQTLDGVELEATLRRAAANNPGNQPVTIRAHRAAPWEFVAQAGNLCKRAGIDNLTYNTLGD